MKNFIKPRVVFFMLIHAPEPHKKYNTPYINMRQNALNMQNNLYIHSLLTS